MATPWEIVWFYGMIMEWTNCQRQTNSQRKPGPEQRTVWFLRFSLKKKSLFCSVSEEGCRQELKGGGSGVQITLGHGNCRGWECYFSPVVERPPALDSWLSVRRSFPLWSNWQLQVQYGQLSRGLQTLYLTLCKPGRQESGFLWKVEEGWSIQPVDSGSLLHRDAVS